MGKDAHVQHIPSVRFAEDALEPAHADAPQPALYEDNTYIDWSKESSMHWQVQAPPKWAVLVVTALLVGYVAIFLDLASVWLNDLRKGLCFSRLDRWSLLNPYSTCPADDWYDWSQLVTGHTTWASAAAVGLPIYVMFVVLFVVVAGAITLTRAPLMKQSGIPEIKLIIAGFNYSMAQYLAPPMLLYKTATLVLVVGSGLWLGSEGPLVHIASCILSMCFQRIYGGRGHEGIRRQLLSAAAASGIAVAFNSPIGGVLLVVELLPSYFSPTKIMWNSFVSATIAVVAMSGFKVFTEGEHFMDQALFDVSFGNISWFFMECVPFVLLGVLGGLFGHAYTQAYLRFAQKSAKRRLYARIASVLGVHPRWAPYVELAMVAVATAVASFPVRMAKMPLRALLKLLFTDCPASAAAQTPTTTNSINFMCDASPVSSAAKLAYIAAQGFVLSTYTYGLALPGGVLMPSLVMGAAVGRLFGIMCQGFQNSLDASYLATCTAKSCLVSPSSYAVVGAASFFSGITKLTLSVVVIMFELTGAVSYVIPIMIAVITAKFVNDWLCEENIYDAWLSHKFNRGAGWDGAGGNEEGEYGPAPAHLVNANKGDGLCEFSSLPERVRDRIPNVAVKRAMTPLHAMRHMCLFPAVPYDLRVMYGILADDRNEGYPLVASAACPLDLGYLHKTDIYSSMLAALGNVQSADAMFCFRTRVPSFLQDEQAAYEQAICSQYKAVKFVAVEPEKSTLIVKDSAPLKQVMEIFERLSLNYLIIHEPSGNGRVSGFTDRFIMSTMMRHHLLRSDSEGLADTVGREFEID